MVGEVGKDVAELKDETLRARERLHVLENTTAAFLQTQRDNRNAEERQYHRLGNIVGLGGLALSVGLLVLSAVTLVIHHG